ncbi:Folylpolyglutamate synthetase [Ascosphaera pollenicola]|nr:Folylpolyglutamate synthetase [Ascosphaera pollenicola]
MGPHKTSRSIAGIEIHIYSNAVLSDARATFDLVFTMHGRGNTYLSMEDYAGRILKEHGESQRLRGRELLVVSFDQRNHGHRVVDQVRNEGWDQNATHAKDMWAMVYGTSQDISLLVRLLPTSIYKEPKLGHVVVSGFSMGGHVTYLSLSQDPLISAGVAVCGCPDYPSLMHGRLATVPLPASEKETLLPPAFLEVVNATGPSPEKLAGKDILVLKGDDDESVPFAAGEGFVNRLDADRVKVTGYPGVGHELTEGMMREGATWIREWLEGHSYDAVAALNTLQSNFATIEAIRKSGKVNNDIALTQMIDWAAKIGYKPSDFDRLNIIHIAGTKGKGSTCAFISSILQQYISSDPSKPSKFSKVGLFTSPHLRFVRERIKINDEPISEAKFAKYFFEVWDRLEASTAALGLDPKAPGSKPVYFRYLTLMALHTYLAEGVDATILECGIGGQYDSTNIIEKPKVTGIARLGIDHVGLLGDTIDKIAWQKAGIMKKGAEAYTVPQLNDAVPVLESRAAEREVQLKYAHSNPDLQPGSEGCVRLGLAGAFQFSNANLAVAVSASFLRSMGIDGDIPKDTNTEHLPSKFRQGLENVQLGGRCETRVEGNVAWHIDGGHTLDSIEASAGWFASHPHSKAQKASSGSSRQSPRVLIFNQQTRDAVSLANALFRTLQKSNPDLHFTHALFCTNVTFKQAGYRPDLVSINANASDIDHLSVQKNLATSWKKLDQMSEVQVMGTIEEAVDFVRELAAENKGAEKDEDGEIDVSVLVTGSLHLVGGVLEVLETKKVGS